MVLLGIIGFFLLVIIILLAKSLKIVQQSNVYIVERLGQYNGTLESGLHFINPVFDRVVAKLDIREQVVNFPPQPVITKDNVTMQIDTVIYVAITDAKKYRYGVGNAISALENLSATTLRNIIGDLELDETLTSRDVINTKIRAVLDEATDAWGMKVTRVEVKNIIPPQDIQNAMEKQMRAEREKREKILTAEGNKTAAITEAEGVKESTILRAEAEKQEKILRAQGEAEAILQVQTAYAEALEKLNAASPTAEVLQLKGYEALETIGASDSSKLIIPSDMGNIASISSVFHETKDLVKDDE
ncbi:SPFH domain-containing protein [Mollicutes bacterium LVI A0078]|nr:SPFH domain-containing protein [Mollicutes bacterium LVI A0075]WOO90054.1 SPFH domain-containing protein [Mollicutes bacterium LVI A0078]